MARAGLLAVLLAAALWVAGALVGQAPPARFVQEDVRIQARDARYTLAVSICVRAEPVPMARSS